MKVYIVTYIFWDDKSILGVYSTEDKAKESILSDSGKSKSNILNYSIEEMDLE